MLLILAPFLAGIGCFFALKTTFKLWERIFLALLSVYFVLVFEGVFIFGNDEDAVEVLVGGLSALAGFIAYRRTQPKFGTAEGLFIGFLVMYAIICLRCIFLPNINDRINGYNLLLLLPFLIAFFVYRRLTPKYGLWKSFITAMCVGIIGLFCVFPFYPQNKNLPPKPNMPTLNNLSAPSSNNALPSDNDSNGTLNTCSTNYLYSVEKQLLKAKMGKQACFEKAA